MKRDSAIEKAISERRITPAQKEHFEALWASNPEKTAGLLASLPEGSWDPKGSAGTGDSDGERTPQVASRSSHMALYGHNPPESIQANGDSYEVSDESRTLHVEALKLLEAEGKLRTYTADEYVSAVEAAADKQGIVL